MILKGAQRGGSKRLTAHLLNTQENDHVEVHEVSGFISDTLEDALQEAAALSQGTRCKQYLFSVALSPPETERVDTAAFEDAISRIEERVGFKGQPRVVVFHEKQGRRHAHCVWSRIDTQKMRAINLPYFKNKLMEVSKELFLDYGWKLPQGFIDREQRNPLNFTREDWQQAKRLGDDPRTIITALKECWSISDNKASFQKALEQRGYYLAKGDRRGYVAVDWRGEVYSLSRRLGVKAKALKERLGEVSKLPSVADTKAKIDHRLVERVLGVIGEIRQDHQSRLAPLLAQKAKLKERHHNERQNLAEKQAQRWTQETQQRQARINKGFRGLWERLTGKYSQMARQNEAETYTAYMRDRAQKDALIHVQLKERYTLQQGIRHIHSQREIDIQEVKEKLFSGMSKDKSQSLRNQFEKPRPSQDHTRPAPRGDFGLSM